MKRQLMETLETVWPKRRAAEGAVALSLADDDDRKTLLPAVRALFSDFQIMGGVLMIFDRQATWLTAVYGKANRWTKVTENTFFRSASLSKWVTAAAVLRLCDAGHVTLDENIAPYLPGLKGQATLRDLLTHQSPLRDGAGYQAGVGKGVGRTELLGQRDNYKAAPGWAYSNFGAGLIASVLESKLAVPFEIIMRQTLFEPLNMQASFLPGTLHGEAADCYRMPFGVRTLNSARRMEKSRAVPPINQEDNYRYAQGNCYINAHSVQKLVRALLAPGFLKAETLAAMQTPYAAFGQRDSRLQQGLGTFIVLLEDGQVKPYYGHQGLAYGAVSGAFYDVQSSSGVVLLTNGANLRRQGVLTDVNIRAMSIWQRMLKRRDHGKGIASQENGQLLSDHT